MERDRELLRRTNWFLVGLRRALSHDHRDEARWAAWGITAPEAQALRVKVRAIATLLHVERATARGRIHAPWFATVDEQREWLVEQAERRRYAEEFVDRACLTTLP